MDIADSWLRILPMNSRGRHMLTLDKARQLAVVSPTAWCIGPYRCGYGIGKQTAYPEWDFYYVVNDNDEPLYFDDLETAVHFLRTQLHIHYAVLLLTPSLIKAI